MDPNNQRQHRVVIIGAGSAGLCMGVQLKKVGIDDFLILEKGDGVGGTWNWNQYPGAECDVQSHLYSFSFEQKLDWSQPFAGQEEILEYLNNIADKFDIRRHINFDTEVAQLNWQHDAGRWQVTTNDGEVIEAQIVVSAIGMFNNIHWPDIPGIEDFEGNYWHSARWNKSHDLSGERVGVIGIAASAIQLAPEIAPHVDHLSLFQRTANWVVPKANMPYTAEQMEYYRQHPQAVQESREEIYEVWNTLATFSDKEFLANIETDGLERVAQVQDPETRRKLTPNHPFGCKRPLFSDLYYPMFNRDNVELVTETIERVTANSVITVDGQSRELDTIIYATGFETTIFLTAIDVTGRDGLALTQAWSDGAQAYLGMSTAGFPNLFMLYGPNTNQGSLLFMFERQCDYIIRQLKRLDDEKLAWMDVRPEVMTAFNDQLQVDIDKIDVWKAGCGNEFYNRSASGRFVTGWPHSMDEFTAQTSKANVEAYEVKAIS
jgi:cation diffusion facilitator CzcD-associated flavoprotein CzcO